MDCAGEVSVAHSHLSRAQECLTSVCDIIGTGERSARKKSEITFQFHLTCAQVLYDGLGQSDEALLCARKANLLLKTAVEFSGDCGIFTFNCGVKEHRMGHLENAIQWLELSVASFDRLTNSAALSKSLRLLCATHMDLNNVENARKACHLAMEVDNESAASLSMLCRVHLFAQDFQTLETLLTRLIQRPDLTLLQGIQLCRDIRTDTNSEERIRKSTSLALWMLRNLSDRFANDSNLGLVRLEHVRLVVDTAKQMGQSENESDDESKELVELIVTEHNSGTVRLSAPVCAELVRLCFDQGVLCKRDPESTSEKAISWLTFATALAQSSGMENDGRAQLLRLLCSVNLDAGLNASALQHAASAIQLCPKIAAGNYLLARCHLATQNSAEAVSALKELANCADYEPVMMQSLAATAQALNATDVMVEALEQYIASMGNVEATGRTKDFIAAARSLIRALSTTADYGTISRVIQTVLARVQEAGGWTVVYPEEEKEGEWCAKAIYNAAGAALAAKQLGVASTLFDLAATLCNHQQSSREYVVAARKHAVACFLDAVSTPSEEQLERLGSHLTALRNSTEMDAEELMLLDFRASLLQPNASPADAVLFVNRAASLASSPYLFERMASACLQSKRGLSEAAIKALAQSFRLHMASRPMNVERCAIVVRNLVGLYEMSGSGSDGDEMQMLQLREVVDVVKSEPSWPVSEKQWLAVAVWNQGASEWRRGGNRMQAAEQWCSISIGLLKLCGANWSQAAPMKAAYQQLLASISSNSV